MSKKIFLEITDLETGEVELTAATVIDSAEQLEALFAAHGIATDTDEEGDECHSFDFMVEDNGQTCKCVTCKTNAADVADCALTSKSDVINLEATRKGLFLDEWKDGSLYP